MRLWASPPRALPGPPLSIRIDDGLRGASSRTSRRRCRISIEGWSKRKAAKTLGIGQDTVGRGAPNGAPLDTAPRAITERPRRNAIPDGHPRTLRARRRRAGLLRPAADHRNPGLPTVWKDQLRRQVEDLAGVYAGARPLCDRNRRLAAPLVGAFLVNWSNRSCPCSLAHTREGHVLVWFAVERTSCTVVARLSRAEYWSLYDPDTRAPLARSYSVQAKITHNPLVAGSSPARPTPSDLRKPTFGWCTALVQKLFRGYGSEMHHRRQRIFAATAARDRVVRPRRDL